MPYTWVNQAESVIPLLVTASQKNVNTYSTSRVLGWSWGQSIVKV